MQEEVQNVRDRVADLLSRFKDLSDESLDAVISEIQNQQRADMTREGRFAWIVEQVGYETALSMLEKAVSVTRRPRTTKPASVKTLVARQKRHPVYLTNACCENAHGSEALALKLNLTVGSYNASDRKVYDAVLSGIVDGFYPLNARESQYIAEDLATINNYSALLGYSVLFRGKKYLFPSIEFNFIDPSNAKSPDYPGIFLSHRDAMNALRVTESKVKAAAEAVGGFVWVFEEDNDGLTHTLGIAIPFEFAFKLGDNYHAVREWLEQLAP